MSSSIPEMPPSEAHLKADNASLGELLGDVTRDLSTLMRQEVELAKAELKQSATKAGKGSGMLAGAGVAGHFVLAGEFATSLLELFALGIPVPAEHFAPAHVVVAVASTVGVILKRGVVGLIHGPHSCKRLHSCVALCVPRSGDARGNNRTSGVSESLTFVSAAASWSSGGRFSAALVH